MSDEELHALALLVGGRVVQRKIYIAKAVDNSYIEPCRGCAFASYDGCAPGDDEPTYGGCREFLGCVNEFNGVVYVEVEHE